jgi:hypothetical protein
MCGSAAWRTRSRSSSVDASRTVTASGLGPVLRDVKAGGRCYVRIWSTANTHRATVQSFDRMDRVAMRRTRCRHRQHGQSARRQKSPEATTGTNEPTNRPCHDGCVHPGA